MTLINLRSKSYIPFKAILTRDHPRIFQHSTNARLRGWQRITTKLNHNNRNYRDLLGLETPRVDSPS
ncbi:hypothetical protein DYB14_17675 [Vibrio cholerae]|nr:hypothetical protein [Vibrio cholerae]TYA80375.1 hypothetical protein FXE31_15570 [Vibrio cholerae]